jgi:NADPH:quinone reductase-like Zn-dependent oxidoreductase
MSLAVRFFSEYRTSEVLRVVDVPTPAPGPGPSPGPSPGQVRLAVRAAGVIRPTTQAAVADADAAALVAKPATVPWEVAGTLTGAGVTEWTALERLKVAQSETELVHAAAGGVGTFAVQPAVARGARVIGTASENHHEQLRSLGTTPATHGK